MIKDKLQILLITYNRKKYLKETFNQIFADDSPIRDYDITILDNASTDGTSELIEEYCKNFSNIEHIRHFINIGGNANICRAIELALQKNKEYFWILCDDDYFNFKDWDTVEKAVTEGQDVILVSHVLDADKVNQYNLINELAFVPAGIYKTSLISSTALQNAYLNIYHSFPHLALACYLANTKHLNYALVNQRIVIQNWYRTTMDYLKGCDKKNVHYRQKEINIMVSYINSYKMLNDKKFRYECNRNLWIGRSFFYSAYIVYQNNKKCLTNLIDFFRGLSFPQKILFLLVPIICPVYYKLKYIIKFLYLSIKTDILK